MSPNFHEPRPADERRLILQPRVDRLYTDRVPILANQIHQNGDLSIKTVMPRAAPHLVPRPSRRPLRRDGAASLRPGPEICESHKQRTQTRLPKAGTADLLSCRAVRLIRGDLAGVGRGLQGG